MLNWIPMSDLLNTLLGTLQGQIFIDHYFFLLTNLCAPAQPHNTVKSTGQIYLTPIHRRLIGLDDLVVPFSLKIFVYITASPKEMPRMNLLTLVPQSKPCHFHIITGLKILRISLYFFGPLLETIQSTYI